MTEIKFELHWCLGLNKRDMRHVAG